MMGETAQRFFALDIGDLYLKFAFFEKEMEKLRAILWGKEELNQIFWKRPLERIWPTIQQAYFSFKQKMGNSASKVILTFSPGIFKAEIARVCYIRKNPKSGIAKEEEQSIKNEASKKAEEKMKNALFEKHGIRGNDFVLQNLEILNMNIDGYEISSMQGCRGFAVEFQFLGTFVLLEYSQRIHSLILQYQLGDPLFIHEVQAVRAFAKARKEDGVFIDLGDACTQIAVVKGGELVLSKELAWGGATCTRHLERVFGMQENIAREFKEEYAKGTLSEESRRKVKELFLPEVKRLGTLVQESLNEVAGVLPSKVFLFGGGSLLPDLIETFEEYNVQNLSFAAPPEFVLLAPKDIAAVENFTQALNPLFTLLFLEYYAAQQKNY